MEFLDKNLFEIIEKNIDDNKRKNNANAHCWYPLNYATFGAEEITSALQSMLAFKTTMSEKCDFYESIFAKYVSSNYAIFLNSGSSSDLLAIISLVKSPNFDLNKGDKVLVPAITWPTQIWSIIQAGLEPILFDCDIDTFNPKIESVPTKVLKECKCIFTTHILGTCANLDILRDVCQAYNLILLEDACESLGCKYKGKQVGNFGEIGTFSSFFSHHITTMEGGMLCTNNDDIELQVRLMRAHGWARAIQKSGLEKFCKIRNIDLSEFGSIDARYLFIDEGYNLRPTEINASFGIYQIQKIQKFNKKRKILSEKFYKNISNLNNIKGPKIDENCDPCFMSLPLKICNNKGYNSKAIKFLEDRGVESRPLIAGNMLRHPVKKLFNLISSNDELIGADFHHFNSFYVGLSPEHSEEDIDRLSLVFKDLDKFLEYKF
tara:strand:+ start:254 stop:1555 length:1302 start_codon:yes stop_codon:yes gene_type:complete